MGNKRKFLAIFLIIVSIALIVSGVILNRKKDDKKEEKKDDNNTKTVLKDLTEGKHSFNSYCPSTGSCEKDIGYITINNQSYKLSINMGNINTEDEYGRLYLDHKKINFEELNNFELSKSFDGFEVYQNYLIIYTSNLEKEEHSNCLELSDLRGYAVHIIDTDMNIVSELSGFTMNNAFTDFKIEDGYMYYYGLLNTGDKVVYDKISMDDLINKRYDSSIQISIEKEC